jgi:hypothetical protein
MYQRNAYSTSRAVLYTVGLGALVGVDPDGCGDDKREYYSGVEMKCKCGAKINRSVTGVTYDTCSRCREEKARKIRAKYNFVVQVKDLSPAYRLPLKKKRKRYVEEMESV